MLCFSFLALAVASAVLSVTANPIVSRSPLITLPLAKVINATGMANIVQKDLARVKALRQGSLASTSPVSVPATNQVVSYTASVGVGRPPTFYDLIVDTGSSNTWFGANSSKPYVPSSISLNPVAVTYGSGNFLGLEYTDTVTIGSLVIENQGIGGAILSEGFEDVDGILGLGPTDLTEGTLALFPTTTIPTVTDNAFTQQLIPGNLVAISFAPTTTESNTNGELTFGGMDSTKFTGSITYTPITTASPASSYWGIDQSITYGTTTIMASTAGIVDTGTTLIYLPTDTFNAYQSATGAVLDPTTKLLTITQTQYEDLVDLVFNIGGTQFALTPNAQIFPRSLNTLIGGMAGSIYLIVADSGTDSGSGLDFINGLTFLERFYSVYDTTNKRVGLATTPFTDAMTN